MDFSQIEFTVFVIALIANISLAIVVLRFAPKNISRYFFTFFVFSQIFWITINYYSFRVGLDVYLVWKRLTLFSAPFHAITFFLFIDTFLVKGNIVKKKIYIPLIILLVVVCGLTLSPFALQSIDFDSQGKEIPHFTAGMLLFAIYIFACVSGGFYSLIRKFLRSDGVEKKQLQFLLFGLSLTFVLVLAFSLLNPLLFKNISTVRFGHLFTLPFVFFTAYAMVRHKFLNLKSVLAEVAVILLNLIIIIQVVNSEALGQRIISMSVLIGTLTVGWLLIKGVYREIRQREILQLLTTQLEAANVKLKALDQARADFITIASHQLRTPPATIKWYVAAILSGDFGELVPDVKLQLEKVQATNNSQISLIDDLLNASRIERGKMEFLFEETELEPITQMTYDQLMPLAGLKNLKLVYNKPKEKIPPIMADKEKLRQVINNFIDNAIKYTKEGSITIDLTADKDNVRVMVSDTGKGIATDLAPNLFEKYNRGKDSVFHAQGLGLGLYVCKIVVAQHNGKIWAESDGEGKGSRFIFTIPIHNNLKATTLLDLANEPGLK